MEARIFKCNCKHEQQDLMYGKGLRVFNPKGKGNSLDGYRCTVCGKTLNKDGK